MIRLATVFSGIGSVEHALQRMGIDHEIVFACDNGDVDILSKDIKDNINEIHIEINELNDIIKKNEDFLHENEYGLSLNDNVENIKHNFRITIDKILDVSNDANDDLIDDLINKLKSMKKVKPNKIKKYKDYVKDFCDVRNYNEESESLKKIYNANKNYSIIKILNELSNDQKNGKASGIQWDLIPKQMNLVEAASTDNLKKIVNEVKEIRAYVSMLHERIKTFDILTEVKKIDSYKKQNAFVNSLYEVKDSSNFVKKSYMANYKINAEDFHWNVSFLNGKQYENQVDLFVGGSPCQSFSLVGKQRGLEDTRGTLFYEYARLISEIKPKVFIYENVKAVLSNDGGRTWETMSAVFDNLGYTWEMQVLNARDYGIPQNRERVFVVGFRNDLELINKYKSPEPVSLEKTMQDFLLDNVSGKYYLNSKGVKFVTDDKNLTKRYTQIDGEVQLCQKKNQQFNWHGDFVFVEENEDMEKTMKDLEKYFLSEKVVKYVLSTGTKNFYSKPKTDLEIARPLLTTMHKMHRAGVDNYVTTQGRLRKLTPRECLRLMGYCDSFKIVVSDTQMYQQAGNSIVVDVMIAILQSIINTKVFEDSIDE